MNIRFKHPQTGLTKECPVGFSWTTLFFNFWVPMIRGHYGYGVMMAIITSFTMGIAGLVFPFTANKAYAKFLIEGGYQPSTPEDLTVIKGLGIAYDPPAAGLPVHKAA